ncbi:MAG: class I SAM-dependent methyltransferase [Chloroflexi bacterium]|nr:class I SAM-dependent methyltransferase [Chloroflexota bacterium]
MSEINASPTTCSVCQATNSVHLIEMTQVPAHCNLLWPTREGAVAAPRGDIRLAYCPQCGHVFNESFDPALMEYTQDYENSLHFSPRFQQYATSLAARLVERHDLRGKDIVGVGSGKGDFLKMLCELGDNRGVGFDPSYGGDGEEETAVAFIQDFYSEKYTHYKADFISCRHVLEHIQDPIEFVDIVRRAVNGRQDTIVFFEVPNVLFTLRDLGIWDIIYEHCSYFSPHSLAQVFRQNGFRILNVEPAFNGQFLTIEAALHNGDPDLWTTNPADKQQITQDVTVFAQNYREKVGDWQERLADMAAAGQRAMVWGAGSKGVTLMNILKAPNIEYVVDINPRKKGMHVAGAGQKIVPPDFLKKYQPDAVIIMNANYKEEIAQTLRDLGVAAEVLLA